MKKVALLFSAVVLFGSLTFGQTPQTQDKAKPAEKTEKSAKDSKSGCDEKTKAACGEAKKSGCCAGHAAKKSCSDTKAPEKK
jgi:hypothetical protein